VNPTHSSAWSSGRPPLASAATTTRCSSPGSRERRATDEGRKPLRGYRREELVEMSADILEDRHGFASARHGFITKRRARLTPQARRCDATQPAATRQRLDHT
jgi:hypothetical protein